MVYKSDSVEKKRAPRTQLFFRWIESLPTTTRERVLQLLGSSPQLLTPLLDVLQGKMGKKYSASRQGKEKKKLLQTVEEMIFYT